MLSEFWDKVFSNFESKSLTTCNNHKQVYNQSVSNMDYEYEHHSLNERDEPLFRVDEALKPDPFDLTRQTVPTLRRIIVEVATQFERANQRTDAGHDQDEHELGRYAALSRSEDLVLALGDLGYRNLNLAWEATKTFRTDGIEQVREAGTRIVTGGLFQRRRELFRPQNLYHFYGVYLGYIANFASYGEVGGFEMGFLHEALTFRPEDAPTTVDIHDYNGLAMAVTELIAIDFGNNTAPHGSP